MSIHTSVTEAEAADRLALRELVDAYAHCADRRDAKGQMALFTEDTHFVVHDRAGRRPRERGKPTAWPTIRRRPTTAHER
ncbi:nuclear transport factor 2 family protein [Streptomyces umbrinus]|uniref:nuclear transport factor 2 family protein n=1 Tax=Streptomyces umbrinus TaxID=67370 RepID=UPI003C2D6EC7